MITSLREDTEKMKNPFSLTFGKEPSLYIKRPVSFSEITDSFESEEPPKQCYLITGVRGSGKTVFLSEVADYFKSQENWIVVDLNPERDMLESLAAKIYDEAGLRRWFIKPDFSFSFHGLTLSLHGETPVSDVESLLGRMLSKLQAKGIRVLITVDEATTNQYTKVFAHSFQSFLRSGFPVFLLMTGLYQNIQILQDEKTLTFLYRAPKVFLGSLNLRAIADSFEKTIGLCKEAAADAAKLTRGYAFAYQVLGYLMVERSAKEITDGLLSDFDLLLAENGYEKVFSELSAESRRFLFAIAEAEAKHPKEIESALSFSHGKYSVYRKRLIDRGILNGDTRGEILFALPRFEQFLLSQKAFA